MLNATENHPERTSLLGGYDPNPVMLSRPHGYADMVICCDHAGNNVPQKLHLLGLDLAALEQHIGLDIGVFSTSHWMAHFLGAPLIGQAYSRLVIDCNRRTDTPDSILTNSDGIRIPGNEALEQHERTVRKDDIFVPYHQEIENLLQECEQSNGYPSALISMHSFTRQLNGRKRPWDVGVIFAETSEIGHRIHHALCAYNELKVGYNVPYQINFTDDYTLPEHAVNAKRPYVEIEICQDIITSCNGQRKLAGLLGRALVQTFAERRDR